MKLAIRSKAPARSNAGGAVRGKARAAQVHSLNAARKGPAKARPQPQRARAVSRPRGPRSGAPDIFGGLARDFSRGLGRIGQAASGVTNPFDGLNLNPFDAIPQTRHYKEMSRAIDQAQKGKKP